jgi:glycosyltransferase involved in cell wall biosynthesis
LPKKGGAESIEIFDSALEKQNANSIRKSVTLEIIGDGPEMEHVRYLAEKSPNEIILHGKKSHDEIMQIMARSHIFIYPSTYPEGLPTVVLEAAANQMAILIYKGLPGMDIPEKIHAVEACNVEDMDERLQYFLSSWDEMLDLALRASDYVIQYHNWKELSTKFLDLAQR